MSRTSAGAALTAQHRQRQLRLRAATLNDLARLFPVWRLADPDSFATFTAAVLTLVQARRRDSAGLAANYFQAFRTAEEVAGSAPLQLADRVEAERVVASLRATGLAGMAKALRAGQNVESARQTAMVKVSGAVARHVLDGARETIIRSTAADRRTEGWQRITAGSPCAFCAMLAARGATYRRGGGVSTTSNITFAAHDHCACTAEPRYEGSDMPPESKRFRDLYNEHASGTDDPLNALRRAMSAT